MSEELGKPDLEPYKLAWVRGLRYKLYNDGRFYDLEKVPAEERRIRLLRTVPIHQGQSR